MSDLPETRTEHGVFHVTRDAAAFAGRLVASGSPDDLPRAERVYDALLRCQERRPGHPHFGNFYWMVEDAEVEDLNAVEFVLSHLIGTLRAHGESIQSYSSDLFGRLVQAVQDGLDEIARLDVHPGYTNIALLDIANTCLGAELLGDPQRFERGARKLSLWLGFTMRSGHVPEYNSPTYIPVSVDALTRLAAGVKDPTVRALASAGARRLMLSAGLRYHAPGGRWAGPHGRAYASSVQLPVGHREAQIARSLADGQLRYLNDISASWQFPVHVGESASKDLGLQLSTTLSRSFTLGTASKPFMNQSNVCIAYIASSDGPGTTRNLLYSRYLTNDKWFGDFYHDTDRSTSRNLLDEGEFIGVQHGTTMLGAYAPGTLESVTAAAAEIIVAEADAVDRVMVDGAVVEDFPATVGPDSVVGLQIGNTCIAIRCLDLTPLGADSGVSVVRRGGALAVEFLQYRGERKSFWEYRSMGGFYRGKPSIAFAASFSELEDCGGLAEHVARLSHAPAESESAPAGVFPGFGVREWKLGLQDPYDSDSTIEMTIDLYAWKLLSARVNDVPFETPMLSVSCGPAREPVGAEAADGHVELGNLTATYTAGSVWIVRGRGSDSWACGWVNPEAAPGTLTVQAGEQAYRVEGTEAGFLYVHGSIVEAEIRNIDDLSAPEGCVIREVSLSEQGENE